MEPTTCIPSTRFMATHEYLMLVCHGATIFSVPAHVFAIYCILYKTPEQMKSVTWYFVNLHIWTVLYDYSVCLMTVPVMLIPTMSGYTLGMWNYFGVSLIWQTVLVFVFLIYMLLSILAIFENRFHTVCSFRWKIYWTPVRPFWLVIHYIIGIGILIPFFFLTPDQNVARKNVLKQLPCLPDYVPKSEIFVLADDMTYHMFSMVSFLVLGILESAIFILLLIINTLYQLTAQKMSKKLFEMQKKFFIALLIQMLVPLIFLIIPCSYACYSIWFNYYNQAFTNTGVTAESFHGLVSTLVMICIHRPYRDAFLDLFWKNRNAERKISQMKNLSAQSVRNLSVQSVSVKNSLIMK